MQVREFPNYTIERDGVVRNSKGNTMKPWRHAAGYLCITFSKDSKAYARLLHRLLAEAYIPQPSDADTLVNHIDGDKQNNTLDNLEWVSPARNNAHAAAIGLTPNGAEHWAWRGGSKRNADKALAVRRAARRAVVLAEYRK